MRPFELCVFTARAKPGRAERAISRRDYERALRELRAAKGALRGLGLGERYTADEIAQLAGNRGYLPFNAFDPDDLMLSLDFAASTLEAMAKAKNLDRRTSLHARCSADELLIYVRRSTGEPRYAEVAALLNAAGWAPRGEVSTPGSLGVWWQRRARRLKDATEQAPWRSWHAPTAAPPFRRLVLESRRAWFRRTGFTPCEPATLDSGAQ